MESATRCPACRVRIAADVTVCPGCGARLKKRSVKAATLEGSREAPVDREVRRPKKKRKKARSGPNYPMMAAVGGGVLVIGILITFAVIAVQGFRKPAVDVAQRPDAAGPGGGPGPALSTAPPWLGKADPPKAPVRPKDDLAIPIEGEPLFASGLSPFVVDLVGVRVGLDNPPVISVYDLRTGERARTAKAIQKAQAPGRDPNGDFYVALGPDGKTLAARSKTTTGTGRKAVTTSEVLVYRLGKDEPVARIPLPQHLSWMEFGRDDDQLIIFSVPGGGGGSATAYDLKKPDQGGFHLEVVRTGTRWRNGLHHPEALAVSPGRNYLAVGEGPVVDLVQLSDGKSAGTFSVPGDCLSVSFSSDGKELAVHSHIPPPKRTSSPPQNYWTTFSLADGKQLTQTEVTGGTVRGTMLAVGPKPGLAVHHDRNQLMVADTRVGAPAYSAPFPVARYFDAEHLVGYDAGARRVTVHRIDPEQLAGGEKELARLFGPRPAPDAADRTALTRPPAPAAWAVPVDPAPDGPGLADSHSAPAGADFVMPWAGKSALAAVIVQRVETPRDRYPLQWQRIDLANGNAEQPIELWPSLLPPGQVPQPAGSGAIVADQTADGSRLALRDAADPARVDVWDKSGKRLNGFLPYGPETPIDGLVWVSADRLLTLGGGRVTGWEVPGPKAVFEVAGYAGAPALSPGRQWFAVQTEQYIDVFETATGKPLGRLAHANPANKPWHAFAVSRDGTRLAAVEVVRPGVQAPGIWGYTVWDLKTGAKVQGDRIFTGSGSRPALVRWLDPRHLLAGGADVIDLDVRTVTATLTVPPFRPLPSPDGRYWVAANERPPSPDAKPGEPREKVLVLRLDEAIQAVPRLTAEDVVLREGVAVEPVSQTGNAARDATIRSTLKQQLAGEGYATDRGQWRLEVTGERVNGSGSLETPDGGRIPIPWINGWVRLYDPAGAEAWKGPLSGGWDMNSSKYKTSKETVGSPGSFAGSATITHFNFGGRDPQDAMAEEAWGNFVAGLGGGLRMPRVLARVNGKLKPLPLTVPLKWAGGR